ncbi:MAG: 2-amino-4-hydroxy-6-hydroxymethyldihydropteridine diphosphokinase [Treponema sp.]|nr:2-amino-4-hydroxy-6-hydroxymethyldihydropteridine diphosphokinase [Treponema sp.]MDD7533903.1 2-amino-4-hydroxy-6-hydroxymethyldihydropteridine diphosphokinase [Treponema sp.]MDY5757495.1 2-amino-4-hydroxy-6-hydroxymethyldihydropteridine diphosphokinase [Treponema sp.]
MKRVLLGLGSNKSYNSKTPLELLASAGRDLECLMKNCVFSNVYKTPAMYVTDQEDFYNAAVVGYVPDDTDAFDFLHQINEIEAKYGRNRSKEIRFGPRPLDIDIELFGNEHIDSPELQIPHIRMEERAFVLIPSIEVLKYSADEIVREKYIKCLEAVEKTGGAEGIKKLMEFPKAVENGTNGKHN